MFTNGNFLATEIELEEIELEGMVETGSITVDGTDGSFTLVTEDGPVPILTNVDTEFEGFDDLSEIDGLEVEVEGMFTNGNFLATEIELEEYEGEVETQSGTQSVTEEEEEEIKLDGTVTGISGGTITLETDDGLVTILTDGNTEFEGFDDLSEIDGLEVKVRAVETNDGLLATEIDLEGETEEDNSGSGGSD
ncbi:MAG: hypothetical protein IIA83_06240 [Thaumarchaeota archaeon]|nr:hypothetical protein [Nitrososphaerota archaeon]